MRDDAMEPPLFGHLVSAKLLLFSEICKRKEKISSNPHGLHPHLSRIGQTAGICSLEERATKTGGDTR